MLSEAPALRFSPFYTGEHRGVESFSDFPGVLLLGRDEGKTRLRLGALEAMLLPLTQEVGLLPLRPACSGSVLSPLLRSKQLWRLLLLSSFLALPLLCPKSPWHLKVCLWLLPTT